VNKDSQDFGGARRSAISLLRTAVGRLHGRHDGGFIDILCWFRYRLSLAVLQLPA